MEKEDDLSTPPLLASENREKNKVSFVMEKGDDLPSSSGSGRDVLELPRIRMHKNCSARGASFWKTSNDTSQEKKSTREEYVLVRRRAACSITTNDTQDGKSIPEEEASRICCKNILMLLFMIILMLLSLRFSPDSANEAAFQTTSNGAFLLICKTILMVLFMIIMRASLRDGFFFKFVRRIGACGTTTNDEQDGERIPQEEAISRICFNEFEQDGEFILEGQGGPISPIFRTTSDGTSQEKMSTHEEYVLVRRRAACSTTTNDEDEKRIPKEEAVCRICFKKFEEDNAFRVDCQCPVTLIHENCEIVWSRERGNNKCEFCEYELGKTPVALIPVKDSAPPTRRQKVNKWNCFTKS